MNNFFEGASERISFTSNRHITSFTSVFFDIFFFESIMALHFGLTVILTNELEQNNSKLMLSLIKDKNIDMLQMTPSRIQLLINYDEELTGLRNVTTIMIGGEMLAMWILHILKNKTSVKIYNMYGSTETKI